MFAPLSVELQSYISKEHKIISRLGSENSKNLNGLLHPLHCFFLQSSATSGSRLPGEGWEVPDALWRLWWLILTLWAPLFLSPSWVNEKCAKGVVQDLKTNILIIHSLSKTLIYTHYNVHWTVLIGYIDIPWWSVTSIWEVFMKCLINIVFTS